MRFRRVALENFKCYADADLTLEGGVTVVHGVNGSGKSSLLEACFFALYGHRALDANLDEVVTTGAEEATVELWFAHGGADYHIERRVKLRGGGATNDKCVLETPEGPVEGVKDVRAYVTDLLRMDTDAFVNCAYVRQGEVNKLINADPGTRQDMIDDLLQLGTLEEYRERASDARVGVKRVRDGKREVLADVESQIASKEDENLHERLNGLKSDLSEVSDEIETLEEGRATAVETRDQAREILENHEAKREEIAALADDIEELEAEIAETEQEREQAAERISGLTTAAEEHRETAREAVREAVDASDADDLDVAPANPDPASLAAAVDDLESRIEDVDDRIQERLLERQEHAGDAETARERAEELASEAEEKREEADELAAELEAARQTVAQQREQLAELDERIAELEASFEDAPCDPGGADALVEQRRDALAEARAQVTSLEGDIEHARERVTEAEELLAEGKCPECGQPVEDSPHVERVDEDRERVAELEAELAAARETVTEREAALEAAEDLADRADELEQRRNDRESAQELLTERQQGLDDEAERVEGLRERAAELDDEAAAKREAAETAEAEAEAAKADIGELNGEKASLKQQRNLLEEATDALDAADEVETEAERLRERRESLASENELRRESLAEKRDRKAELEEAFDEERVEHAEGELERAEQYIEQVDGKLEGLRERRDDLQGAIGATEQELETLEELRERRDALAETVDNLDSLYEEAEQLESMYADLRAELRQQNVEKLERLLNETFDLVYTNDAYSHIELDGSYELTVFQKDDEPLEPEQLSGGERALFNLSLRCAIYRLLAEGIEGTAPMPPLILDEPTVFLDSGHVSKLVDLVESMRDLGVEQILVVSHDEELVGAADDLVRVAKDPTSNRSRVERTNAVEPGALESEAVEGDD
ncbi:DNA double-strand break repair ATPase Rad50 [Haloglomus salinum]|uniref:DNA double-strand break repair ATPase Rad50 n=1 Tax=Haloglomus salinum TaxID=2962673 RepID=UPI0020C9CA48|nr:DNA double-strand break repair ATPase Rad50 [Haloglomus salinum]